MKRLYFLSLAAVAQFALADVFSDAKHYFVFEEDLNGDGLLQANEVRDLRHWGTRDSYTHTVQASNIVGNDLQPKGPTWVETKVAQPGRGLAYTGTALRFTVDNRAQTDLDAAGMVKTNSCTTGFQFDNASITGTVTVLMRCRMDSFNSFDAYNDHAWLVNNGENWATVAGSNFGFKPHSQTGANSTKGYPSVYFGRSELCSDISVTTNVWYDVGIVLKDTGDGGAEAFYAVHDEGLDQVYAAAPAGLRKPQNFRFFTNRLAAGSGAFTNETKHITRLTIGAEKIGDRGYRAANKGFAGDVQRIVMWDRALSSNELVEAICQPAPSIRLGIEDGSAGEFGARSDISETYTAQIPELPLHRMPSSVDAVNPDLDLNVKLKGDHYKLGQILRVKAAAGASGTTWLRPTVNGRALEAKALQPGRDAEWFVKKDFLQSGVNALKLTRLSSSTASSLAFDVIELTGSWVLGTDNSNNGEFSVENCTVMPCIHYVGNWNFANMQRGIPSSYPKLTLRFFVPERFARRHDFVFRGRAISQGASDADRMVSDRGYVKNQYPFKIHLNGEKIWETPGMPNGTSYSVTIPAGTLVSGWNEIVIENPEKGYTFVDETSGKKIWNANWICFDHHTLEIQQIPNGTMILMR